jgi:hypothetical protein
VRISHAPSSSLHLPPRMRKRLPDHCREQIAQHPDCESDRPFTAANRRHNRPRGCNGPEDATGTRQRSETMGRVTALSARLAGSLLAHAGIE